MGLTTATNLEGPENAAQAGEYIGILIADEEGCERANKHRNDRSTNHKYDAIVPSQHYRGKEKTKPHEESRKGVQRRAVLLRPTGASQAKASVE